MKLFSKYNRVNVISTILIFIIGGIAFSFLLHYFILHQVDEDLKIEMHEVQTYVDKFNHLPAVIETHDQYTSYIHIDESQQKPTSIRTQTVYNKHEKEKELVRIIGFNIHVNNDWYFVTVTKSLEGTDDLIQSIIVLTVILILIILITSVIINRIALRKLWKPFYDTLNTIQQFSLNSKELVFDKTNIEEFQYLNTVLQEALTKAQQDYQTLKEFTENASHELQTPLAVIQSKLELLIQNENLSENESNAIQSAYNAVQNLSKLNQSLLLLAKIENKQFNEQTKIDVKELLQNKINQFCELWKNRNLISQVNLSDTLINGNTYLIEILLNNLLSNATKHNIENGSVEINLKDSLEITNTGISNPLDENLLYKRFSSQNKGAGNHGLGLSIIQQICVASGFTCTYEFHSPNKHSFIVNW